MKIADKGALICAVVAILLAVTTWVRGDAGRSQQIADLSAQFAALNVKLDHMQAEIDDYLLRHDGHE